jgi:uncharacterized protein (TIGR02145 family)
MLKEKLILSLFLLIVFGYPGLQAQTVNDIDGNVYKTVKIGTQVWMAENLRVTHYRNGDSIPEKRTDKEWKYAVWSGNEPKPAWCYYNNDPANDIIYGKLYNWFVVNDPRGLAPEGWHLPSDEEWTSLTGNLGGGAGVLMKSTSGWQENKGKKGNGTNTCGFTALPGGYRYIYGSYSSLGDVGLWWSSTECSATYAYSRHMGYNYSAVKRPIHNKQYGFSVRCLRD